MSGVIPLSSSCFLLGESNFAFVMCSDDLSFSEKINLLDPFP